METPGKDGGKALPLFTPKNSDGSQRVIKQIMVIDPNKLRVAGLDLKMAEALKKCKGSGGSKNANRTKEDKLAMAKTILNRKLRQGKSSKEPQSQEKPDSPLKGQAGVVSLQSLLSSPRTFIAPSPKQPHTMLVNIVESDRRTFELTISNKPQASPQENRIAAEQIPKASIKVTKSAPVPVKAKEVQPKTIECRIIAPEVKFEVSRKSLLPSTKRTSSYALDNLPKVIESKVLSAEEKIDMKTLCGSSTRPMPATVKIEIHKQGFVQRKPEVPVDAVKQCLIVSSPKVEHVIPAPQKSDDVPFLVAKDESATDFIKSLQTNVLSQSESKSRTESRTEPRVGETPSVSMQPRTPTRAILQTKAEGILQSTTEAFLQPKTEKRLELRMEPRGELRLESKGETPSAGVKVERKSANQMETRVERKAESVVESRSGTGSAQTPRRSIDPRVGARIEAKVIPKAEASSVQEPRRSIDPRDGARIEARTIPKVESSPVQEDATSFLLSLFGQKPLSPIVLPETKINSPRADPRRRTGPPQPKTHVSTPRQDRKSRSELEQVRAEVNARVEHSRPRRSEDDANERLKESTTRRSVPEFVEVKVKGPEAEMKSGSESETVQISGNTQRDGSLKRDEPQLVQITTNTPRDDSMKRDEPKLVQTERITPRDGSLKRDQPQRFQATANSPGDGSAKGIDAYPVQDTTITLQDDSTTRKHPQPAQVPANTPSEDSTEGIELKSLQSTTITLPDEAKPAQNTTLPSRDESTTRNEPKQPQNSTKPERETTRPTPRRSLKPVPIIKKPRFSKAGKTTPAKEVEPSESKPTRTELVAGDSSKTSEKELPRGLDAEPTVGTSLVEGEGVQFSKEISAGTEKDVPELIDKSDRNLSDVKSVVSESESMTSESSTTEEKISLRGAASKKKEIFESREVRSAHVNEKILSSGNVESAKVSDFGAKTEDSLPTKMVDASTIKESKPTTCPETSKEGAGRADRVESKRTTSTEASAREAAEADGVESKRNSGEGADAVKSKAAVEDSLKTKEARPGVADEVTDGRGKGGLLETKVGALDSLMEIKGLKADSVKKDEDTVTVVSANVILTNLTSTSAESVEKSQKEDEKCDRDHPFAREVKKLGGHTSKMGRNAMQVMNSDLPIKPTAGNASEMFSDVNQMLPSALAVKTVEENASEVCKEDVKSLSSAMIKERASEVCKEEVKSLPALEETASKSCTEAIQSLFSTSHVDSLKADKSGHSTEQKATETEGVRVSPADNSQTNESKEPASSAPLAAPPPVRRKGKKSVPIAIAKLNRNRKPASTQEKPKEIVRQVPATIDETVDKQEESFVSANESKECATEKENMDQVVVGEGVNKDANEKENKDHAVLGEEVKEDGTEKGTKDQAVVGEGKEEVTQKEVNKDVKVDESRKAGEKGAHHCKEEKVEDDATLTEVPEQPATEKVSLQKPLDKHDSVSSELFQSSVDAIDSQVKPDSVERTQKEGGMPSSDSEAHLASSGHVGAREDKVQKPNSAKMNSQPVAKEISIARESFEQKTTETPAESLNETADSRTEDRQQHSPIKQRDEKKVAATTNSPKTPKKSRARKEELPPDTQEVENLTSTAFLEQPEQEEVQFLSASRKENEKVSTESSPNIKSPKKRIGREEIIQDVGVLTSVLPQKLPKVSPKKEIPFSSNEELTAAPKGTKEAHEHGSEPTNLPDPKPTPFPEKPRKGKKPPKTQDLKSPKKNKAIEEELPPEPLEEIEVATSTTPADQPDHSQDRDNHFPSASKTIEDKEVADDTKSAEKKPPAKRRKKPKVIPSLINQTTCVPQAGNTESSKAARPYSRVRKKHENLILKPEAAGAEDEKFVNSENLSAPPVKSLTTESPRKKSQATEAPSLDLIQEIKKKIAEKNISASVKEPGENKSRSTEASNVDSVKVFHSKIAEKDILISEKEHLESKLSSTETSNVDLLQEIHSKAGKEDIPDSVSNPLKSKPSSSDIFDVIRAQQVVANETSSQFPVSREEKEDDSDVFDHCDSDFPTSFQDEEEIDVGKPSPPAPAVNFDDLRSTDFGAADKPQNKSSEDSVFLGFNEQEIEEGQQSTSLRLSQSEDVSPLKPASKPEADKKKKTTPQLKKTPLSAGKTQKTERKNWKKNSAKSLENWLKSAETSEKDAGAREDEAGKTEETQEPAENQKLEKSLFDPAEISLLSQTSTPVSGRKKKEKKEEGEKKRKFTKKGVKLETDGEPMNDQSISSKSLTDHIPEHSKTPSAAEGKGASKATAKGQKRRSKKAILEENACVITDELKSLPESDKITPPEELLKPGNESLEMKTPNQTKKRTKKSCKLEEEPSPTANDNSNSCKRKLETDLEDTIKTPLEGSTPTAAPPRQKRKYTKRKDKLLQDSIASDPATPTKTPKSSRKKVKSENPDDTTTPQPNKRKRKAPKSDDAETPNKIAHISADAGPEFIPPTPKPTALEQLANGEYSFTCTGPRRKYKNVTEFNPRLLLIRNKADLKSDDPLVDPSLQTVPKSKDDVQCALCMGYTPKKKWLQHVSDHYGIGWVVGTDPPLNIRCRNAVLNYMVEFFKTSKVKGLNCRICKGLRRSALGLLSHIEQCCLTEEEVKESRVMCEYCEKEYSKNSLPSHMRTCSEMWKKNKELNEAGAGSVENAAEKEVVLSNTGRLKRKSVIKAENKFKDMDSADFHPEEFVKNVPQPRRDLQEVTWLRDIKLFGKGFCPEKKCLFTAETVEQLQAHCQKDACALFVEPGYWCMLCKFRADTKDETLKHVVDKHKPRTGEDFQPSDDDAVISQESSSEDGSSGDEEGSEKTGDQEGSAKKKSKKKSSSKPKPVAYSWKRPPNRDVRKLLPPRGPNIKADVFNWQQDFVKSNHSDHPLFTHAVPNVVETLTEDTEAYFSKSKVSPKFVLQGFKAPFVEKFGKTQVEPEQWRQLERLGGLGSASEHVTYLGGPVKAIAWVPLPSGHPLTTQYLASVTRKDFNKFTRLVEPKQSRSLIYIHRYQVNYHAANRLAGEILYAVAIDDGPVHCIEFLPSGGYDPERNRLGLVAVGTINSEVKVYSLPLNVEKRDCDMFPILRLEPALVLCLDLEPREDEASEYHRTQCTSIAWSQFAGHNHVIAGYINGFVSIFDIEEDEDNLNRFVVDGVRKFVPISYFWTKDDRLKRVIAHYDMNGLRWLGVCHSPRRLVFFDVRDLSKPLLLMDERSKNECNAFEWPIIWSCPVLALGDAMPTHGTCLNALSPLSLIFVNKKFERFCCSATDLHYNPWNNMYAAGSDNGDIHVTPLRDSVSDHTYRRKQDEKLITSVDIVPLNSDEERKNPTQPSRLLEADCREQYGLVFGPIKPITGVKYPAVYSPHRIPPLNQARLSRVHQLRFNLNQKTSPLLAVGYVNGLLRVLLDKWEDPIRPK